MPRTGLPLMDAGEDLTFPVEIYARHLQCSPPGLSQAWRKAYASLEDLLDINNNDYPLFAKHTNCSMQVKLELGHKATIRKKPTPEGFTHDWTMFVRGLEGSNIQHFVDRVVFHLHESFPKPKRVVKEPPYQINESGYAGFNLPIEIYFKNKEEPKKILFSYDLFLHTPHRPPVNHVRCEKLTFQNPTEDFRRKLIKAGGIAIPSPADHTQGANVINPTESPANVQSTAHTPESRTFADLFGAPLKPESSKKHKSHSTSSSKDRGSGRSKSTSSATSVPSATPPPSTTATPPTTPSKESRSQATGSSGSGSSSSASRQTKDRNGKRHSEAAGMPDSSSSSSSSKKKKKEVSSSSQEDAERREERRERDKQRDREKQERDEKDKKEKERKKEKKSSSKEMKSKHRSSKKDTSKGKEGSSGEQRAGRSPPPPPSRGVPPPAPPPPPAAPKPAAPPKPAERPFPSRDDDELSAGEISDFDDDPVDLNINLPPELLAGASSPASTLSFSSKDDGIRVGGGGALGALFAEMEDEELPLSPLRDALDSPQQPPKQTLPPPPLPPPPPEVQELSSSVGEKVTKSSTREHLGEATTLEQHKSAPSKAKKRDRESRRSRSERRTKEASKENKDTSKEGKESDQQGGGGGEKPATATDTSAVTAGNTGGAGKGGEGGGMSRNNDLSERDTNHTQLQQQQPVGGAGGGGSMIAPNGESLNVLLELQRRLMGMTDRDLVQQVVNVIEETGRYKISDATFDFDLCSLDINTVKKLQVCLEMTC